ncbi:PqqD family protein [Aurantiacibacter zhengii]|uniref:PqqD family protein n=1 Tax=Aurantiacibacter zhengii TaxID=2307003 RepID=A0A418NRE3_9SPHN|nr:PqqD family protein [Aurantiacibacter zhengii]
MSEVISSRTVPLPAKDVLSTEVSGAAVLMSMDSGKFIELNETGRDIWKLTDGSTSVSQIVDTLQEQYDVAHDHCLAEVVALYRKLHEEGLVEISS